MTDSIILLAEDHPAWSKLLSFRLSDLSDLIIQDNVSSKAEVIAAIEKRCPSLLVLDVKLRDGCGLALCPYCQQLEKPVSTLILTAYDEDAYMARALAGGAIGYLLKTEAELAEIITAIHHALQGERLWTDYQLLRIQHWQQVAGDKWAILTEREREIVAALIDFKCDAEIAETLQISLKTVGNHVTSILEKLDMPNRREVARWAVKYKLVEVG
ncbi:MAG: response regulator transcription factor [Anaerolineales bacterium]|nr:response regulator transcription factor [Anaerolineales bacterium]